MVSCGTSRDSTVRSACAYTGSRSSISRRNVSDASPPLSSGRSPRRLIRRLRISSVGVSQTDIPLARTVARVSAFMNAPPPVARTCGPLSSRRAITRASPARKYGSPCVENISEMVIPAWAFSISISASTNGIASRAASLRPTDDLPAPIMPTSTTERRPSAAPTEASTCDAAPLLAPLCATTSDMLHLYRNPTMA